MILSVIVTVYNKELYIKNTLFSIFNQDIPPEEIIIIDDGSTDNSLKIINNLELPKSATVFSINNSGVSAAFETLVLKNQNIVISILLMGMIY